MARPYKNIDAMREDGTIARTARFDMRCTPSMYARTWRMLEDFKEAYDMKDASCAEVFERVVILVCEHHLRDLRYGDSALRSFMRAKALPLPPEDYIRNMRARLGVQS